MHTPVPTVREALTPDGACISYDDLGQGEQALLVLPGWAHHRRVYEALAPLTAAHRRTLALDWSDAGAYGAPAWSLLLRARTGQVVLEHGSPEAATGRRVACALP